jgi:hypothetical protein
MIDKITDNINVEDAIFDIPNIDFRTRSARLRRPRIWRIVSTATGRHAQALYKLMNDGGEKEKISTPLSLYGAWGHSAPLGTYVPASGSELMLWLLPTNCITYLSPVSSLN